MKALMTAVLMLGFLATANASTEKAYTKKVSAIEPKAGFVCPYKKGNTIAVKKDYSNLLADAPTKSAPAVKSGTAKSADGIKRI